MNEKLVAEEGILKGTVFTLENADSWVIGRDPAECQFILEDPSVSRKHLLCYRAPEGIMVENFSHTNPALINEEALDKPQLLRQGDTIKIGNELFRFYTNVETHIIEDQAQAKEEDSPAAEGSAKPMENVEEMKKEDPIAAGPAVEEEEKEESERDSIFEEAAEGEKPQIAEVNFGVTETGRWLLKVIGGPNNGAEFYMQAPQSYVLGTDPLTCDIVFHDTSVSRQHVRITVNPDETLTIEDLNSRNGTAINGQLIKEKQNLPPSVIVNIGTTSFVVYDREGEMQTIISPLMPSIVKVLQKDEAEAAEKAAGAAASKGTTEEIASAAAAAAAALHAENEKKARRKSQFILVAILSALFIVAGVGTTTLFREQPVAVLPQEHISEQIKQALTPFPAVQYSFNKSTGNLLLIGHVKAASDKTQLLYNLKELKFIKYVDDSGIVIDEYVWNEINQILSKNPAWRGISVYSPTAGQFVITGYLETRKQAEQLSDYLSVNFPYVDLLQQKIIVDEDITNQVNSALEQNGIREIKTQMVNGELTLTGSVPSDKGPALDKVIAIAKDIPGVRAVKNFVTALAAESSLINISDRYEVTGMSNLGGDRYTVIINGRILSTGDTIDGMRITSIRPGTILLEQGDSHYKIDFRR